MIIIIDFLTLRNDLLTLWNPAAQRWSCLVRSVLICCNVRLDLIKHLFISHSVEATFHFVCCIKGCLHSFKFGSTYSSFKTHANRKHPNWQDYVNKPDAAPLLLPTLSSMNLLIQSLISLPLTNIYLSYLRLWF